MSPSAEPASGRAEVSAHLVPANLLGDGEVVILAIKPSNWFVLIVSLPVLASAAVVAAAAYLVDRHHVPTPEHAIFFLAALAATARVAAGCWQWLGRTYVLTNLRVVVVRGLLSVRVTSADLAGLDEAVLAPSLPERLLGVGSIYCLPRRSGGGGSDARKAFSAARAAVSWSTVAGPREVQEVLDDAIRRARRRKPEGPTGEAGGARG